MDLRASKSAKRKHREHTGPYQLLDARLAEYCAATSSPTDAVPQFLDGKGIATWYTAVPLAVLASCRSALMNSPGACRAAFTKHRAFVDPALAKALEVAGGYVHSVKYTYIVAFYLLPPIIFPFQSMNFAWDVRHLNFDSVCICKFHSRLPRLFFTSL